MQYLSAIVLAALLFLPPQDCKTYLATRHNAFATVLRAYPDRFSLAADGYGAEGPCETVGQWRTVIAGEKTWRVKLIDCHPAGANWTGFDLDDRLWWASGLPNAPTEIKVCKTRPDAFRWQDFVGAR